MEAQFKGEAYIDTGKMMSASQGDGKPRQFGHLWVERDPGNEARRELRLSGLRLWDCQRSILENLLFRPRSSREKPDVRLALVAFHSAHQELRWPQIRWHWAWQNQSESIEVCEKTALVGSSS